MTYANVHVTNSWFRRAGVLCRRLTLPPAPASLAVLVYVPCTAQCCTRLVVCCCDTSRVRPKVLYDSQCVHSCSKPHSPLAEVLSKAGLPSVLEARHRLSLELFLLERAASSEYTVAIDDCMQRHRLQCVCVCVCTLCTLSVGTRTHTQRHRHTGTQAHRHTDTCTPSLCLVRSHTVSPVHSLASRQGLCQISTSERKDEQQAPL